MIWRVDPPEDDYKGPEGSQVIPVVVIRIGPKTNARQQSIYELIPDPEDQ